MMMMKRRACVNRFEISRLLGLLLKIDLCIRVCEMGQSKSLRIFMHFPYHVLVSNTETHETRKLKIKTARRLFKN
jgi:hypothetical protein